MKLFNTFILVISITIMVGGSVSADSSWNYELLNYMAAQRPDPDKNDNEEVKKRFKSHFIKSIYLENVFSSNHLFYGEDNEADYGLVNEMMLNQFADYLAETDFLDLSAVDFDE